MKIFKQINWALPLAVMMVLALLLGPMAVQAAPPPSPGVPIYVVNDPGDAPDGIPGDGICDTGLLLGIPMAESQWTNSCTLRAAIEEANLDGGPSVIAFEVCRNDMPWSGSGGSMAGPADIVVISPGTYSLNPPPNAGPLPALTDARTYINGYTQGFGPGSSWDAVPPSGLCTATRIATPNSNSFSLPLNTTLSVSVEGSQCNPIASTGATTSVPGGIVPSGSIIDWSTPPTGNGDACSGFTVTSDENVIAGLNIRDWENAGILIMPMLQTQENKPSDNVVWGDFIGTDIEGATMAGNRFGVEIIGASQANHIGDTTIIPTWGLANWIEEPTNNERNLISGNDNPSEKYGTLCTLQYGGGNFIEDGAGVFMGVDPCIRTDGTAQNTFLGGALDNHVRNSYIGTDINGTASLRNTNGVWLNYDAGGEWPEFPPPPRIPGNHIGGCVAFPFTAGPLGECYPQTVDEEQDPNLISGNARRDENQVGGHGVWLYGEPQGGFVTGVNDVDYNEIGGNFIGTNGAGTASLPNSGNGVFLLGQGESSINRNEVGATTEYMPRYFGVTAAPFTDFDYRYGNLISGNGNSNTTIYGLFDNGVEFAEERTDDNRVAYGNIIGLDSSGETALGNGDNGVLIHTSAGSNKIHNNSGNNISVAYANASGNEQDSDAGAISANGAFLTAPGRHGIFIDGSASDGNEIFRNCIGSDANDCLKDPENLGNARSGVYINDSLQNLVGLYTGSGDQRNWIHHNNENGVAVVGESADGNTIRYNSLWFNDGANTDGDLGIDLGDDNDTPNDSGDGDTGPNQLQNYPDPLSGTYQWIVNFESCAGCTVDIYATLVSESDWDGSSTANPQAVNNGEGRYWLQSATASGYGTTDSQDVSARITAADVFGAGGPGAPVCITLTTTDGNGNTSEFSPCMGYTPTAVTLADIGAENSAPLLIAAAALLLVLVSGGAVLAYKRYRA